MIGMKLYTSFIKTVKISIIINNYIIPMLVKLQIASHSGVSCL